MNWIFDLLILIVLLVCIYLGKKRGFIKTFFGFFGSIFAFLLTAVFAKPVGTFLCDRFFYPYLKEYFLNSIFQASGEMVDSLDFSSLPEVCHAILAKFGTDAGTLHESLKGLAETSGEAAAESASRVVMMPIAESVGMAVAYFGLFIVFSILIRVLVHVLDLVAKMPILNFSNHFLGLFSGALQGCFLAIVLASGLILAAPALQGSENEFFSAFSPEETLLVRFFGQFDWLRSALLKG